MCDTCGKAFRVAANFYAHRKKHRLNIIPQSINQIETAGEMIHTLGPMSIIHEEEEEQRPDALTQVIQGTLDGIDYVDVASSNDHQGGDGGGGGYLKHILINNQFDPTV